VYHVNSQRWAEIKGVEEVVCMAVRDKGCEERVMVYIENSDRVK
jgi:hypothetical protein